MSSLGPRFWAGPIRYTRWAARERPAYFWSVVMGLAGPVMLVVVPPIRKALGDEDAPPIPQTYPGGFEIHDRRFRFLGANANHVCSWTVPVGPRKTLSGYDDE